MASAQEIKKFISWFSPIAQEAYRDLGKVKPSVCIGMACYESGYGLAETMAKHNAYLGHKVGSGKTATKYWNGTFFNARTSEEYVIGEHTAIKADFRSYRDAKQCVYNFYELLNTNLYKIVLADAPYDKQLDAIKQVGYMTSSTEISKVKSIISKWDLTKYDTLTIPQHIQKRRVLKFVLPFMEGSDVIIVQQILQRKGYDIGSYGVDGRYGKCTEKAVKQFQTEHGLVSDGIVGPKTWTMLEKYN